MCSEADAADYLATFANNYLRACSTASSILQHTEGPKEGIDWTSAHFIKLLPVGTVCCELLCVILRLMWSTLLGSGCSIAPSLRARTDMQSYRTILMTSIPAIALASSVDSCGAGSRATHMTNTLATSLRTIWMRDIRCGYFWRLSSLDALRSMVVLRKAVDDHSMVVSTTGSKASRHFGNLVCHNSCIINGFSSCSDRVNFRTPDDMLSSMSLLGLKNTKSRRSKLRNLRVAHIAAALYGSYEFCTRASTRFRHADAMDSVRRALMRCVSFEPGGRARLPVTLTSL